MSGEERGEQRHDSVDDVALYPSEGVRATPPGGTRPLPEEYVEGQQGVHVHLRVEALREGRGTGLVGCDLCAVFKRTKIDVDGSGQVGSVREVSPSADSDLRDMRRSMFVHVVKLTKHPEGVRRVLIPSIVRLQSLDDCLRSWIDVPDFVTAFALRPFSVAKDRELGSSIEGVRQGATSLMPDSEFVGEIVEGRAEVVEAVPDDEAEACRDWFGEFDVSELLAALTVDMTDVSVSMSLSPLTNLRVKSVQVVGGPI
jgi:hypothetical protein